MATIRLLDARRGLYRKCEELFGNEKIAELIYRYLCDGIEECEDVKPERIKGNWIRIENEQFESDDDQFECDRCGYVLDYWIQGAFYNYCPNCGADMKGETMAEWIVRETEMPLATGQEVVGELIRCKECEFYTAEDRWCRRLGLCGAFDADGYCSHGERKGAEDGNS